MSTTPVQPFTLSTQLSAAKPRKSRPTAKPASKAPATPSKTKRSASRTHPHMPAAQISMPATNSAAISTSLVSAFKGMQWMNTGLLSRGLRWIQARNTGQRNTQRLKVCATVGLGEKRFVSLIECDGLQFLVGGGGANVAFLSQVPNAQGVSTNQFGEVLERAR